VKYYTQSHAWPYIHLIAALCGLVCLVLILVWQDPYAQVGFLVCAVFSLAAAWMLWQSRNHYLEIDPEWIVHHGFKRWRLKRADVLRVEQGRKGFVEEYDPFIKVHAHGHMYEVDSGFLINDQRIAELVKALSPQT
jgi:hypothetical protein